jgi:ribosomal protein S18 acetylase RimI-like enzyme
MTQMTAIAEPADSQFALRTATQADRAQVEAAMTLAFSADPAARWAWSDPHQFLRTFMPLVTLFGGKSFDHGSAYVAGDFRGVAQFLPPGVHVDDGPIGELFERNMTEPGLGQVLRLFERMASFHPKEPHWYIPLIGVDPAFQGRGCGSALMRRGLAVCDHGRQLAYLEATSPANRMFYERHGFRTLGEIRSGDSPPMFPMVRTPRQAPAVHDDFAEGCTA